MARTRGTRIGNGSGGAGWGGPAKGPGKPPGNREAGRGNKALGREATPPGQAAPSVADLMIAMGLRVEAAERWAAILRDPAHPRHAEMIAKAAERMDGAAVQPIRGEGGAIMIVTGVERATD